MRAWSAAPVLLGITLAACSRRVPSVVESDASAPLSAAIAVVLDRPLGHAALIFHEMQPLVAEIDGARCHVWDLDEKAYRGAVEASVCKTWWHPEPAIAAPAAIAAATPRAPERPGEPLLFARSRDGQRALSGRRTLARVSQWGGPELAARSELTIEDPRSELAVVGLAFTAKDEAMALTLGNGPVLWLGGKPAARQPASENHVNVSEVSADRQGRYAGYSGMMDWGRTWLSVTAVIRTSDGEDVLANRGNEPLPPRVVWAEAESAALLLDVHPLPLEPGQDVSVAARLLSPSGGLLATGGFERGNLHRAETSPHGTAALLTFDAFSSPPPDGPDARTPRRTWVVFGRAFSAEMSGNLRAVAWSDDEKTLGVALDEETVSVFAITPTARAPLGRSTTWKGSAPIALAPDGQRALFVQRGALVFGDVASKAIMPAAAIAPRAIAWGARAIAAATADEVFLLDPRTGAVKQKLALPGVTAIVWDPAGARFAATAPGEAHLIEEDASAPSRLPVAPDARLSFAADGALVIREKRGIQRMIRRDGAWAEVSLRQGVDGALASRDGLFLAERGAFLRLADNERIHLEAQGNFTDSGAYDRAPPKQIRFREGDVIDGRLLREGEMTLEPTPDLLARFASGAPIPHPKRSR